MDPLTAGIGAGQLLGGIIQYYNSEKARGAEASRLQQISDEFDKIKPPNYNFKVFDPPALQTQALAQPQFQNQPLTPAMSAYVQQAAPTTIQNTADMQTGRAAQLAALQRLQSVGAGEFDPQYQQAVQTASRQAAADAQSRNSAILQDYARRGQSGSGLNLATQLSSNAQIGNNQGLANLQAATNAYKNRLSALSSGAQIGSQINQDDANTQGRNANIINNFNQQVAGNRQTWGNNQANVLNNNALNNQQTYNQTAQNTYNNANTERNAQNNIQTQLANWNVNQADRQNNLQNMQYQNQLGQLNGKFGISNAQGANNLGAAQDRNAAIQGLTNAGTTVGQGYLANQQSINNNVNADNRANLQSTGSWMTPEELQQRRQSYSGGNSSYTDY